MTGERAASSPALGEPLGTLDVRSLAAGAPAAADLRARAVRLHAAAAPLPAQAQWAGDHRLNPDWGLSTPAPRPAAVLFLLCADDDGTPAVLFTERAAHLPAHAGQVALPGGKIEAGERPLDAALREAHEEVGLPAAAVEPLGLTEAYATRTGFLVATVVGVLSRPVTLRPDPGEVAGVFLVPASFVLEPSNAREIRFDVDGRERRAFEMVYGSRRIWGVTAGILQVVQKRLYSP